MPAHHRGRRGGGPALTCDALADVQRYARTDLGVRLEIDLEPLREAAGERAASRGQRTEPANPVHDQHLAVGEIDYGDGHDNRGILVYVKASVTGDEPDYVLAYERRHASFPHETTGDQFFSEEQMEAYRALGFHAAMRALSGATDAKPGELPVYKIHGADPDGRAHDAHERFRMRLGLGVNGKS